MNIEGSVALVTGANRGLGRAFTRLLLEHGAAKVYAGARDPASVTDRDVTPVQLDVTSMSDIAAAAQRCSDVTLVVNNAGVSTGTGVLAADALDAGRREMDTNVFGTLAVSRAFAPVLAVNGGGALVNVLSVLSWVAAPSTALYSASKAAEWSLTNSLRVALHPQGTLVVGVHCGYLDTDMAAHVDAPKLAPEHVVELTLEAIEQGSTEVLADDISRHVKAALAADVTALYPTLAAS
jgi:NAD(P)-dependent dehydrogenase (short-subunit alcohol dehydrogenase family)